MLVVFIGLLFADLAYAHNPVMSIGGIIVIAASFIVVCLLTGDPPGGADSMSQSQ